MKICFPARKKHGENYATLDEMMGLIGQEKHGSWLAGTNRMWHGGIHLTETSAPGAVLQAGSMGSPVPLQCMVGGEVVAWRVNRDYLKNTYNDQTLQYSTTFVLVRSTCRPAPKNEKTWVEFFSLYMGLAPLSAFPKMDCFCITEKGDGLRKRQYNGAEQSGQAVPLPTGSVLKKGTRIVVIRSMLFDLKGNPQLFGLAKMLTEHNEPSGKPFWISLDPEFMEPNGEKYAHLPVWMQYAVTQGIFDTVVKPNSKLEIKAGDAIGILGEDIVPAGMGKIGKSTYAHIEVISVDSRLPTFLNNPGCITTGCKYIRVHQDSFLYTHSEETFTKTSACVQKDIHAILPVDKCNPKESDGKRWYQIGEDSWLSQDDVDVLNQYDLKELGFSALAEESTPDMSLSLKEGWVKSAFAWLSVQVRPERGIREQQLSGFYKAMIEKMNVAQDGQLTGQELYDAMQHPEMKIRDIVARLVVKHESEWFGGSGHQKWTAFFQDYDPLRVDYAKKWLDDMEWMSQVEPFKPGKSVWHMHPVVFLNALADVYTDVIEFQTTLGIYRISKKSAEFILSWESYVPNPYVPAGDQSSGVTVGYGYDLGQQTTSSAQAILSGYYSELHVERLLSAIGKKGDEARGIVQSLSDITIDKDKALKMAMVLKQRYCQTVIDIYPQAINLPPDSAGAILSLVYNRGPSLALPKSDDQVDRRREMREIRDDFSQGEIINIPGRLRSMKRLWPNQRGLGHRREGEAKLIEDELSGNA